MSGSVEQFNRMQEEKVREFWQANKIIDAVRAKSKKGKETFYFMDGPPYASGHLHIGTALNKIMKDCAIRSQRMQAKKIFDRPGFDTHGLPIENKVEKKLGFKTKKDIENFGVEKFIKECRTFATEYVESMGKECNNLGDWMPYEDPYLTLTNDYIEAIWYAFKKADEKGLLYLGKYPVHVCPHCATAVAYNEIVYTKLSDTAVFIKMKVKDVQGVKSSVLQKALAHIPDPKNTFLIVWTTTPWTLPANTGIMVHPKYEYAFIKMVNGETWVVAKELVDNLMGKIEASYVLEKIVLGSELEGLVYEPLFRGVIKNPEEEKKAFRVILSDRYVTLDTGSGLVHTAPGHGKEDFDAGTKAGLPVISPVGLDGTFSDDVEDYSGKEARSCNELIIAGLEKRNLLPYKHSYAHDYPLCWRCDSPLLMVSVPQWFIKVSQIRQKMIEDNAKVKWVPVWMNDRMKNWLENLSDWPVSRARYWGTPLPIWVCACGEKKVIGSVRELRRESKIKNEIDLHKPLIDEITLPCKCGKEMTRVPEVLDVWFDSGVSSWANLGFPANDKLFKEFWPADLNIEMTEQVRGWWNSQSILSTVCFDELPYKAVSVHGMVLDVGKKKMSKSKGGLSPEEVVAVYGRDLLRSYLLSQSRGTDFSFDVKGVSELGSFFNTLSNSLNYAKMYMNINFEKKPALNANPSDLWFASRVEKLSSEVVAAYNSYEFFKAFSLIQEFVDKDFSRGYLQLVRARIPDLGVDDSVSFAVNTLLRLIAPIAPHAAEHYYQSFRSKDNPLSIHLLDFVPAGKYRNEVLEESFSLATEAAAAALALRSEKKLRVRWQLEELVIESKKDLSAMNGVVAKIANVKKVSFLISGKEDSARKVVAKEDGAEFVSKEFSAGIVHLNIFASSKLREEWEVSELLRLVQDARKKAGLTPGQKVVLEIECDDLAFLKNNESKITQKTSTKLSFVSGKKLEKLVDKSFWFEIKKNN